MATLSAFAVFLLLQQSFCLNSVINYINKHKSVLNSSVLAIKTSDNKTIVQYKYVIASEKKGDLLNGMVLKVGFFQNPDADFDCGGFTEKWGYSWDVLQNLQQTLKFK